MMDRFAFCFLTGFGFSNYFGAFNEIVFVLVVGVGRIKFHFNLDAKLVLSIFSILWKITLDFFCAENSKNFESQYGKFINHTNRKPPTEKKAENLENIKQQKSHH
jgi:hypothetical protein